MATQHRTTTSKSVEMRNWLHAGAEIIAENIEDGSRWYRISMNQGEDNFDDFIAYPPQPSVTTVLGAIFGKGFPEIASQHAAHAADRGKELHIAGHLLSGARPGYELDWSTIDPEVESRARWFQKFLAEYDWRPTHAEFKMYEPAWGFGGELDEFGNLDSVPSLIDFKGTFAGKPRGGWQTAGYLLAFRAMTGNYGRIDRYTLHLGEKRFELLPQTDLSDRDVFLAALACYKAGRMKLKGWP